MMIVRSILAVVLGFMAMLVVVVIGAGAIMAMTGVTMKGPPTPVYLALNVALSLLAALPGGWVTRRLAPVNPTRFVGVLAFLVLALGWVTAIRGGEPGQPIWYGWVVPALGALGVLAGGRVWKQG